MPKKRRARGGGLLKDCKSCGGSFIPKRKTQIYCSDKCSEGYYDRHYYMKTEIQKTCPNCGNTFTTTKPKKQTYCTPECREDAKRKRIDGVTASAKAERQTYLGERYATFARDGFRCTVCGKSASDGVTLDVEDAGKGKLKTVCNECKTGKEFVANDKH